MACTHTKGPGQKRCRECNAEYFRQYYKTRESLAVKGARKEGFEEGVRAARVVLLEAGDSSLTGFTAAELVRELGMD